MRPIIKSLIDLLEVDLQKPTPHYAYDLIQNPSCPVEILKYFADESFKNQLVHSLVVSNRNCPKNLMQKIFDKSGTIQVYIALASNPNCPPKIMLELFYTGNEEVLFDLVCNPNCSAKVLQAFWKSSHDYKHASLTNKNATLSMLKAGAASSNADTHSAVARTLSDKITPEILASIVDSADADLYVLENPKCTAELMHKILSRKRTREEMMSKLFREGK